MHAAVALTARTALLTSLAFVAGCSRSSDRVVFDGRITQVDAAALERACGPRDPNAVSNPPLPPGKQWAKFGLPLEHLTTDPTYVCHVTWDARTGVVEAIQVSGSARTMAELLPFAQRIADIFLPVIPRELAPRVIMMASSPVDVRLGTRGAEVTGGFQQLSPTAVDWNFWVWPRSYDAP